MTRRFAKCMTMIAVLGCVAAFGAGKAQAQCGTGGCNPATHHWSDFSGHNIPQGWVGIGMWWSSQARYFPMMCRWDGTKWLKLTAHVGHSYATNQLTADTSICLGDKDTALQRFTVPTQCHDANGALTVVPFGNGGHNLNISGEGGNDTLDFWRDFDWPMNMCGGPGSDYLYGGPDHQYITGGSNDDEISGFENTDNVRGNSGRDIIIHRISNGNDYLRGETESDCLDIAPSAPYDSRSSCGTTTEADYYRNTTTPPASCEAQITNCCLRSDAC